jgi:release factor glutamine methyltransferase
MTIRNTPHTVRTIHEHAVRTLTAAHVPSPDVDAELLIGHTLNMSRGEIQAMIITDRPVALDDIHTITELVERRAHREPLQHITGRAPFRSLNLAVGPGVFVPRPETEQVTQLAIDALKAVADPAPYAVDLGTGSGAIALSMAVEVPHAHVFAVENCAEAFAWATQNFREIKPRNAQLVFSDLADAFTELNDRVSVVISNPPYIPLNAIPRDPEVELFDPPHALYGGEDGLDVIKKVSTVAHRLLHRGGTLIIEHGEQQASTIASLLNNDGWHALSTHRDLTGRHRATTAIR